MCLFMGKGQKKFPPYFQDIFPSQDFKHCLFGLFSMVAGFHSGYWSAYVLLSRCRGCCAGRPCGSCRQMCLYCVLTHFCSHPHTSTIQSLLPPRGILRSPTHRRHYHPHILLLLLLYHLISAGRRERRQDTRF